MQYRCLMHQSIWFVDGAVFYHSVLVQLFNVKNKNKYFCRISVFKTIAIINSTSGTMLLCFQFTTIDFACQHQPLWECSDEATLSKSSTAHQDVNYNELYRYY